jgi:hypothetical protein
MSDAMKKMAIFVEGLTELRFVDRLLREIVAERSLEIVHAKASGGARGSRRMLSVSAKTKAQAARKFFFLIVDSGTDNRVGSDIRDNYEAMAAQGFSSIVGIRDVRPDFSLAELPKLRRGLCYRLKTKPIQVLFVLGVMEIEAWFLAEHSHYSRVHPAITPLRIQADLGFDPICDDMQLRLNPAQDLNDSYALEGLAYKKKTAHIQRTIDALDYAAIYCDHPKKFPDVANFIIVLDAFLV